MSKDVAALRAAVEQMFVPLAHKSHAHPQWPSEECDECSGIRRARFRVLREAAAAISSNAILIDPTAPETVAALAAALLSAVPGYQRWMQPPIRSHHEAQARSDAAGSEAYAHAAAILPAFVARLRGET